jgi:hypothetical protein
MRISGSVQNRRIVVPVKIKIDKFNLKGSADFLLDTGSTVSFINESTASKISLDYSKLLYREMSTGIGGEAEMYEIEGFTRLTFENDAEKKTIPRKGFFAMRHNFCEHVPEESRRRILALQGVIGMDMLRGFRFSVVGQNYTLEI